MAALTADRLLPRHLDNLQGVILDVPVAAATTIYKGAFVRLGTDGITPCAGTSVEPCLGIAVEQVVNAGAAGAALCKVQVGAMISHPIASIAAANIGDKCYASDDQTLTLVATTNEPVGQVLNVPATGTAIIRMNPAVGF